MGREIERKFLVSGDSWRGAAEGTVYRQGYLSTDPDRSVRVRVAGDKGFLTIKGRTEGASRAEFEYDVPRDEAEAMLASLCLHPLIEKTRYRIPFGDHVWEVDAFFGDNAGLLLAEVELADESEQPDLPPWVGPEVTGDPRYYNANLVTNPYSTWG